MKIMGINGSPRDGGNSETLLRVALNTLDCETEQINLRELEVKRCLACSVCGKKKSNGSYIPCALDGQDDICDIYRKLESSNGFILATPVYFGLPSPLLVDFMNRSRFMRHQDFRLLNKVFGVIAISGRRTGGNETTIFSSWLPFIRNGCIPVGNMDKSCQFGVVGWAGGKKEILKDSWAIIQAQDMAKRIKDLAEIIEVGEKRLSFENPYEFCYGSGSLKEFMEENNDN